jgi:CelD/BcsL family acetyltransferase involved in cellulose biosynthesis
LKPAWEPLLSNNILMPAASAFVTAEPCTQPTALALDANSRAAGAAARAITVERASGERLSEILPDWHDLVGRADEANVFMHPAALRMAERHLHSSNVVLLAWREEGGKTKLAGLWAFAVASLWHPLLPVRVLKVPPAPHAYLATPVIDRDCGEAVLDAMLNFLAGDGSLPAVIALDPIAFDGPAVQALARALKSRASTPCIMSQGRRPMLASGLDGRQYLEQALSASSRKKLRQHRRRLEEKGTLESRICNTPDAVVTAFEDFLALEAAGWKGRRGTALSCSASEAAFARGMVADLAQQGETSVHGLYLSGRPVSLQVVLRSGATAFTWKTAYDETLGDFSPGMLLLEDYTKTFLADASVTRVDSCAHDESGFMASWSERQAIAQVWFDTRRGTALSFVMLASLQKALLHLRTLAKQAFHWGRRRWKTR